MPGGGGGGWGVLASQLWAGASTIMRRAGCALAGSRAGDASTRPAPAATVVVRTSRRDNIGGLLLRALSGYAVAAILSPFCSGPQQTPPPLCPSPPILVTPSSRPT